MAAPLDLDDIERHFAAQIEERADIAWDERDQAVRARRERRLGAVLLETGELRAPDPGAVLEAVLDGLRRLGLAALPWTPALRQWQARVALMRRFAVPAPAPWPDMSDAALLQTLGEWAPPWLAGFTRREHFARIDLENALRGRLSHAQLGILDREAPTHYVVPSGSRLPVDYLEESPSLSVRLQEMFGLTVTPTWRAAGCRCCSNCCRLPDGRYRSPAIS